MRWWKVDKEQNSSRSNEWVALKNWYKESEIYPYVMKSHIVKEWNNFLIVTFN